MLDFSTKPPIGDDYIEYFTTESEYARIVLGDFDHTPKASISDVRIWNSVLLDEQILEYVTNEKCSPLCTH